MLFVFACQLHVKPASAPITLRHVSSPYRITLQHDGGDIVTIRGPHGVRKARWPADYGLGTAIFARYDRHQQEWVLSDYKTVYRLNPRTGRSRKVGTGLFVATVAKQDILIQRDGTSKTSRPELKFLRSQLKDEGELIAIADDLSYAVMRDAIATEATHTLLSLRPPYSKQWLGKWLTDATCGNLISVVQDRSVLSDAWAYSSSHLWYIDAKKKTVRRIGAAFTFGGCWPFSTGKEIVFYNSNEGGVRKETRLSIRAVIEHQSKR